MNDTPPVDLAKLEELFKNERATGKYSGGAHHHGTTASESMDASTVFKLYQDCRPILLFSARLTYYRHKRSCEST